MRGTDDRCNFRGVPGGRRATSVFSIAGEDLERAWPFGALPRSGSGVLGRRALICSPPALERDSFIFQQTEPSIIGVTVPGSIGAATITGFDPGKDVMTFSWRTVKGEMSRFARLRCDGCHSF
jgi:hypothetical protein